MPCHDPVVKEGGPLTKRTTTTFSFSRRLGYTHYDVDVTYDPDAKATYEDRVLELIRSGLTENHHLPGEYHKEQQTA